MEIKKVLNLSQEEVDTLVAAGNILSNIEGAFEKKDVDELAENNKKLIAALVVVANKLDLRSKDASTEK